MKKLLGLLAVAMLLSFGTATYTFAGDPAPAPTDDGKKDTKKPDLVFNQDTKDDEKKDDKGGK